MSSKLAMRAFIVCVVAWFGILAGAPSVLSQIGGGSVTGTVTDPGGAVVPNATVTAKSVAS